MDRSEEVLHSVVLDIGSIDEVLVLASNDNLSGNCNLIIVLIAKRRLFLVSVVESDGDSCLGHSSLTILVDELLKIAGSDMTQVGDSEEKADGIQDVTFARPNTVLCSPEIENDQFLPIETSDGIKLMVKSFNFCSLSIGLEPVYHHFLHKHDAGQILTITSNNLASLEKIIGY